MTSILDVEERPKVKRRNLRNVTLKNMPEEWEFALSVKYYIFVEKAGQPNFSLLNISTRSPRVLI